jgi:transposase
MNGNSLGVVLSSGGLAGAERSEGERSEPQHSAAPAKAGAAPGSSSRPDSEVVAKAKRRTFSTAYKIRILEEADCASATPGGVGALLRREGLYSSHLTSWRRARANGIFQGLKPRQRGRKSERDPLTDENEKLRRQVGQLTEKLRKAEIIIDVQKKVAALLGRPIPEADPEENS